MSRRKQGRPQQRKNTESLVSGTYTILFTSKDGIQRKMKLSVEQEKDLLVCGDCQTNFPLHDIVKFIRHKIQHCNKENLDCLDSAEEEDEDDEDPGSIPVSGCISSKQPSISAPISRKESLDSRHSPRPALDAAPPPRGEGGGEEEGVAVKSECDSPSTMRIKEEEGRLPLRPKSLVDAESNTTLTEPSKFVCETCKCTFTSAWSLLQHAQKEHGMKIYTTSPGGSSSESGGERRGRGGSCTNSDGHATPSPRPSVDLHRTPPSAGTGSAPPSPFPPHASFPFRLPQDGRRPPISPFSGPTELPFPMDMDPFRIRPLTTLHSPGLESHNHYHYDRTRLETSMDFSKRLQQLACTSAGSPLRKGEGAQFPSSRSTPTGGLLSASAASVSPGLVHSPESPSKSGLPGKVKSCEFCGKSFRFQSNLIVHRRSHTGEKPYRCSLCPHACTQQSKLKRHMKTHYNKSLVPGMSNPSTGSEGSGNSPRSTPDSSRHHGKMDDMEDEDEDEEDEEEEDMDEDMEGLEEEEGLNEEDMRALKEERKTALLEKALKEEDGDTSQEEEQMEGEEEEEERRGRSGIKRKGPSRCESPEPGEKPPPTASSLLSEVMENSGLTGIQPYNEAFKQALAENIFRRAHHDHLHGDPGRSPDRSRSSPSSNAHNGSSRCSSRDGGRQSASDMHRDSNSVSSSQKMSPGLSPSPLLTKAIIKREPSESLNPHLNNSVESAAATGLYPRFWFPPLHHLRDIYAANLHPSFGLLRDPNHNGLSVTASDSALHYKSVPAALSAAAAGPKPGPSGPLPSSNGVGSIPRKDRRNDTCEFCGKVFKNCSNLTVHRRSHTGEKPYKCELCSYACAQSSKLTRHMKTHGRIGKDVYRCKFCAMPFSVASTLEKHMRKCVENRQARLLHGHEPDSSDDSTTASNL